MGKLKLKKDDVWVDMTPMSDVMVLLLTFFMLSANFVKNEVVKVVTPKSRTETKVPTSATLDIMIKPDTINKGQANEEVVGRVFLGTDKVATMDSALNIMLKNELFKKYADALLKEDVKKNFLAETQIGIDMKDMAEYLALPHEQKTAVLKSHGVSLDSINGEASEFQLWIKALKQGYKQWYEDFTKDMPEGDKAAVANKLDICIKADKETPYITFKKVIAELQDIMESRYKLLTEYKKEKEGGK
jgi:biopolymer transport protein ExbD